MLFSEWHNKQCIHKNWQSYYQINRETICAKELPFRVQPFRGVNCGLIPVGTGVFSPNQSAVDQIHDCKSSRPAVLYIFKNIEILVLVTFH